MENYSELLEILNGNKINIDKKYLTKFSWRKCAKDLKKVYLKINNNEIEHLRCSGQIDRY